MSNRHFVTPLQTPKLLDQIGDLIVDDLRICRGGTDVLIDRDNLCDKIGGCQEWGDSMSRVDFTI